MIQIVMLFKFDDAFKTLIVTTYEIFKNYYLSLETQSKYSLENLRLKYKKYIRVACII